MENLNIFNKDRVIMWAKTGLFMFLYLSVTLGALFVIAYLTGVFERAPLAQVLAIKGYPNEPYYYVLPDFNSLTYLKIFEYPEYIRKPLEKTLLVDIILWVAFLGGLGIFFLCMPLNMMGLGTLTKMVTIKKLLVNPLWIWLSNQRMIDIQVEAAKEIGLKNRLLRASYQRKVAEYERWKDLLEGERLQEVFEQEMSNIILMFGVGFLILLITVWVIEKYTKLRMQKKEC
jgi:amino acid transporter